MNKVALITGASGGIGKELALIHAAKGGDLVLVARSADALETLQEELKITYKVNVDIISEDITANQAPQRIYDTIKSKGIKIDYLINNAGVGGFGAFHERSIKDELNMLHLNIEALVVLTHLFLPEMIERKSGKILNVSSIAGFLPGPLMTTYYATKAFVNSFSFGLAQEVRKHGVTVTALCPGPLKTNFDTAAGMGGSTLFNRAPAPYSTALKGYRAMEKGRLKILPNLPMRIGVNCFVPFLPLRWILAVMETMHKR
jgi:short-subunit dehydrogenase